MAHFYLLCLLCTLLVVSAVVASGGGHELLARRHERHKNHAPLGEHTSHASVFRHSHPLLARHRPRVVGDDGLPAMNSGPYSLIAEDESASLRLTYDVSMNAPLSALEHLPTVLDVACWSPLRTCSDTTQVPPPTQLYVRSSDPAALAAHLLASDYVHVHRNWHCHSDTPPSVRSDVASGVHGDILTRILGVHQAADDVVIVEVSTTPTAPENLINYARIKYSFHPKQVPSGGTMHKRPLGPHPPGSHHSNERGLFDFAVGALDYLADTVQSVIQFPTFSTGPRTLSRQSRGINYNSSTGGPLNHYYVPLASDLSPLPENVSSQSSFAEPAESFVAPTAWLGGESAIQFELAVGLTWNGSYPSLGVELFRVESIAKWVIGAETLARLNATDATPLSSAGGRTIQLFNKELQAATKLFNYSIPLWTLNPAVDIVFGAGMSGDLNLAPGSEVVDFASHLQWGQELRAGIRYTKTDGWVPIRQLTSLPDAGISFTNPVKEANGLVEFNLASKLNLSISLQVSSIPIPFLSTVELLRIDARGEVVSEFTNDNDCALKDSMKFNFQAGWSASLTLAPAIDLYTYTFLNQPLYDLATPWSSGCLPPAAGASLIPAKEDANLVRTRASVAPFKFLATFSNIKWDDPLGSLWSVGSFYWLTLNNSFAFASNSQWNLASPTSSQLAGPDSAEIAWPNPILISLEVDGPASVNQFYFELYQDGFFTERYHLPNIGGLDNCSVPCVWLDSTNRSSYVSFDFEWKMSNDSVSELPIGIWTNDVLLIPPSQIVPQYHIDLEAMTWANQLRLWINYHAGSVTFVDRLAEVFWRFDSPFNLTGVLSQNYAANWTEEYQVLRAELWYQADDSVAFSCGLEIEFENLTAYIGPSGEQWYHDVYVVVLSESVMFHSLFVEPSVSEAVTLQRATTGVALGTAMQLTGSVSMQQLDFTFAGLALAPEPVVSYLIRVSRAQLAGSVSILTSVPAAQLPDDMGTDSLLWLVDIPNQQRIDYAVIQSGTRGSITLTLSRLYPLDWLGPFRPQTFSLSESMSLFSALTPLSYLNPPANLVMIRHPPLSTLSVTLVTLWQQPLSAEIQAGLVYNFADLSGPLSVVGLPQNSSRDWGLLWQMSTAPGAGTLTGLFTVPIVVFLERPVVQNLLNVAIIMPPTEGRSDPPTGSWAPAAGPASWPLAIRPHYCFDAYGPASMTDISVKLYGPEPVGVYGAMFQDFYSQDSAVFEQGGASAGMTAIPSVSAGRFVGCIPLPAGSEIDVDTITIDPQNADSVAPDLNAAASLLPTFEPSTSDNAVAYMINSENEQWVQAVFLWEITDPIPLPGSESGYISWPQRVNSRLLIDLTLSWSSEADPVAAVWFLCNDPRDTVTWSPANITLNGAFDLPTAIDQVAGTLPAVMMELDPELHCDANGACAARMFINLAATNAPGTVAMCNSFSIVPVRPDVTIQLSVSPDVSTMEQFAAAVQQGQLELHLDLTPLPFFWRTLVAGDDLESLFSSVIGFAAASGPVHCATEWQIHVLPLLLGTHGATLTQPNATRISLRLPAAQSFWLESSNCTGVAGGMLYAALPATALLHPMLMQPTVRQALESSVPVLFSSRAVGDVATEGCSVVSAAGSPLTPSLTLMATTVLLIAAVFHLL